MIPGYGARPIRFVAIGATGFTACVAAGTCPEVAEFGSPQGGFESHEPRMSTVSTSGNPVEPERLFAIRPVSRSVIAVATPRSSLR